MLLQLLLICVSTLISVSNGSCFGADARDTCEYNQEAEAGPACTLSNNDRDNYCSSRNRKEIGRQWPSGGPGHRCIINCGPVVQTRVRRNWWSLNAGERQEYRDAIIQLAHDGGNLLQNYALIHSEMAPRYHGHLEFLPYHRGLIYRLETAIRALGNVGGRDYSNFALPYFDHSVQDAWDIVDDGISFLGDWEDPGWCITQGKFNPNYDHTNDPAGATWGLWTYQVHANAADELFVGLNPPRCLCRWPDGDPFPQFNPTRSEIVYSETYESWSCSNQNCNAHTWGHDNIGGYMQNPEWSPSDPIFWLHHTYIDYLWASWQTFHGYQQSTAQAAYHNEYDVNLAALNPAQTLNTGLNQHLTHTLDYQGSLPNAIDFANPTHSRNTAQSMLRLRCDDLVDCQYDNIQYVRGKLQRQLSGLHRSDGTAAGAEGNWFTNGRRRLIDADVGDENYNNATRRRLGNLAAGKKKKEDDKGTKVKKTDMTHLPLIPPLSKKEQEMVQVTIKESKQNIALYAFLKPKTQIKIQKDSVKSKTTVAKIKAQRDKKCPGDDEQTGATYINEQLKKGVKQKAVLQALADKECECKDPDSKACGLPKGTKQCWDWVKDASKWDKKHRDIKVTKDDLLKRNEITNCQKKTINARFNIANGMHILLSLCLGCMDQPCGGDLEKWIKECQVANKLKSGLTKPSDIQLTNPLFRHNHKHGRPKYDKKPYYHDDDNDGYYDNDDFDDNNNGYKPRLINDPNNYNYHWNYYNMIMMMDFFIIFIIAICCIGIICCIFGGITGLSAYYFTNKLNKQQKQSTLTTKHNYVNIDVNDQHDDDDDNTDI